MFRKSQDTQPLSSQSVPTERVTSVLGAGTVWKGQLSGTGGVRIEGSFEGDITLRGLLVVGETGRVTCQQINANVVIVAGAVRGDITAEKLEIRSTGRVWGNVVAAAFATEEGAFLRGQVRMEERVEITVEPPAPQKDGDLQAVDKPDTSPNQEEIKNIPRD
jgi:cytoskeletal protein CcmA (bactofilin family)